MGDWLNNSCSFFYGLAFKRFAQEHLCKIPFQFLFATPFAFSQKISTFSRPLLFTTLAAMLGLPGF